MKKVFTICILFFLHPTIKAQFPNTHSNYFEGTPTFSVNIASTPGNIWQIGPPQKNLFNSAATLPNVIVTDTLQYYPTNNTSAFTFSVPVNMSFGNIIKLQWKQKLDMDSHHDGGTVELSVDNGLTWQNVFSPNAVYQFYGFQPANKDTLPGNIPCFSGTDPVWRDVWLCLFPLNNLPWSSTQLIFRFTFKSDSIQNNKEGWMIDNFYGFQTYIHPIKENSQTEELMVYPNTTSGIVNVEIKKTAINDFIENIELLDIHGKVVESFGRNFTKVVLDISKHKEGIYYMRVSYKNKIRKVKVVYEKE